jgi:transcriptional regulator with XRE-family HTH domain
MSTSQIIAERIGVQLRQRGWTQAELGRRMFPGLERQRALSHYRHLNTIIRGRRPRLSVELLARIATALEVSLDYLCGRTTVPTVARPDTPQEGAH